MKFKFSVVLMQLLLFSLASWPWVSHGLLISYILLPLVVFLVLLLLLTAGFYAKPVYKYSWCFVLYLFFAPFILEGIGYALSEGFSRDSSYDIVYEFQTPNDVITTVNHVAVEDYETPIEMLKQFYNGYCVIKSRASVVKISSDSALITTLGRKKFGVFGTLRGWARTLRDGDGRWWKDKSTNTIGNIAAPEIMCMRYIGGDIIYFFLDKNSCKGLCGEQVSLKRVRLNPENIESDTVVISEAEWWDYETNTPKYGTFPFKRLGITPDFLSINKSSKKNYSKPF